MCQRCSFQIRIKPLERSPEPQRGWLSDLSWVLWMLCQRWTWPCNTVRPPRPTLLERRDGETYVSSVSASSPKTYIDTFHVISVRLWRPCWTEGHGKRSSFNPWCLSSQYHYQQLQLAKESPSLLRIFNISTLESSTFDIVWMFNLKVGVNVYDLPSAANGVELRGRLGADLKDFWRTSWVGASWSFLFLEDLWLWSHQDLEVEGISLGLWFWEHPEVMTWRRHSHPQSWSELRLSTTVLRCWSWTLSRRLQATAWSVDDGWCSSWFSDLLNYYELLWIIHDFIFQASQCFAVNEP